MSFDECNLDLDPMILVLKLDLDILVIYLQTKQESRMAYGTADEALLTALVMFKMSHL